MELEGISRHEMEMKALTDSLSRIRHLRKKRTGLDAAPSPASIPHPSPSTPSTATAATASSPFASSASSRPFFRHTRPASPSSAQSLPPPAARPSSLELRAEQCAPSHWDVRSWLPEGLAAASQATPASASRDDASEQSASVRGDESAATEAGEGAASEDVLRANERLMMHVAASRWASQGASAQANAEHRAPSPPRRAHDAGEADDERSDATARFHVASGAGLAEARGRAEIAGYKGGKVEAKEDDDGEATSGAGNKDGEAESRAEGRNETLVGAGAWRSTRVNELESEDDSWDAPDPTSRGLFGGGSSAFFNPLADDVALNLRLSLDDDDDEDEEDEVEDEEERDEEEIDSYFAGASVETGSRGGDSIGVSAAGKSGTSYERAAGSGSDGWGKAAGGVGKERRRGGRKETGKAGGARMAAARRELEEQRAVVERKWRESQMEMRRAARMAAALKATIDSIDCVDSPARAAAPAYLPAPLIAPPHGSLAALPSPVPATAVTTGAPAALALAVPADGGGAGGRSLSDTGGGGMGGESVGAHSMGCSRRALVEARRLRERLEGLMRRMEAQGKADVGGSSGAGSECAESEAESSSAASSRLSWAASSSASRGASSSGGSGDGSGGDATWLLKRKILRDAGEMAHLERTMARIAADVATTKDVSARMEGHAVERGEGDDEERGGAETEAGGGQRKRERGDGGGEGGSSGNDGTLAVLQALAARMEGEVERVREEQEAWRQRAAVAEAEARSLRRQVQQRDHAGDAMSASLRAELEMLRASKERTRRRQLAERGAWRRAAYQLRAAMGGEQLAQIRELLPPPPSTLAAPPAPPPVSPAAPAVTVASAVASAAAVVVVPQLPARRVAPPAAHSRKGGGGAGVHALDGAQGGKPRAGRRVGARNGEVRSSSSAAGAILRRNGERVEAEGGAEDVGRGNGEGDEERRRGKVRRVGSEGEAVRNGSRRVRGDAGQRGGREMKRGGEVRQGGEEGRGDATGAASHSSGSAAGLHAGAGKGSGLAGGYEQGGGPRGEGVRMSGETAGVRGEGRDAGSGEAGSEVVAGMVWEVARVLDNEWVESGAEGPRGVAEAREEAGEVSGREVTAVGERRSGRSVEREGEERGREQGEGQGGQRQQEAHTAVREREQERKREWERAAEGSAVEGPAVVSPFATEEPFKADRASHGEGAAGAEWTRHSADSAAAAALLPRSGAAAGGGGACSKSHEWHAPTPAASQHTHSPPHTSHTSPPDASPFSFPCLPASPSSTSPSSPSLSPHPLLIPAPTPTPWGSALRPSSPRQLSPHATIRATPPPSTPRPPPRSPGGRSTRRRSDTWVCCLGTTSDTPPPAVSSRGPAASSRCQMQAVGVLPPPPCTARPTPPCGLCTPMTGLLVPSGPWQAALLRYRAVQGSGARWRAVAAAAPCRAGAEMVEEGGVARVVVRGVREGKERVGGGRGGREARGVGGAGGGVGEGRAAGRGGERRQQEAVGAGHSEETHVPWVGKVEVMD
ncbi:unnamed protein product [Closterium sp. Yama58-4]|nr:unnamed protein product [Closterium sp. Yama58-4]